MLKNKKKYYFNIFLNKKYFKKQSLPINIKILRFMNCLINKIV